MDNPDKIDQEVHEMYNNLIEVDMADEYVGLPSKLITWLIENDIQYKYGHTPGESSIRFLFFENDDDYIIYKLKFGADYGSS